MTTATDLIAAGDLLGALSAIDSEIMQGPDFPGCNQVLDLMRVLSRHIAQGQSAPVAALAPDAADETAARALRFRYYTVVADPDAWRALQAIYIPAANAGDRPGDDHPGWVAVWSKAKQMFAPADALIAELRGEVERVQREARDREHGLRSARRLYIGEIAAAAGVDEPFLEHRIETSASPENCQTWDDAADRVRRDVSLLKTERDRLAELLSTLETELARVPAMVQAAVVQGMRDGFEVARDNLVTTSYSDAEGRARTDRHWTSAQTALDAAIAKMDAPLPAPTDPTPSKVRRDTPTTLRFAWSGDFSGNTFQVPIADVLAAIGEAPLATEVAALTIDDCKLCGTKNVWRPGNLTADDHRAPCGWVCRASDGYPGQVHPDHCPCAKPASAPLAAQLDEERLCEALTIVFSNTERRHKHAGVGGAGFNNRPLAKDLADALASIADPNAKAKPTTAPPPASCDHAPGAYYSAEHDNFYCRSCKAGMGEAFHRRNWYSRFDPMWLLDRPAAAPSKPIRDAAWNAIDLLDAIARVRGLAQGGEQSPNAEECIDTAKRLRAALLERSSDAKPDPTLHVATADQTLDQLRKGSRNAPAAPTITIDRLRAALRATGCYFYDDEHTIGRLFAAIISDAAPAPGAGIACEGFSARWCPNCGTCACSDYDAGGETGDNPACPLHGTNSMHPHPTPQPDLRGQPATMTRTKWREVQEYDNGPIHKERRVGPVALVVGGAGISWQPLIIGEFPKLANGPTHSADSWVSSAIKEMLRDIADGLSVMLDDDEAGYIPMLRPRLRDRVRQLRALADAPPTVRDLTAAPEFRTGKKWIRFDIHDLRRELRQFTHTRQRGHRGQDTYGIESRTWRGMIAGEWRSWIPDFNALDAPGVLIDPEG